MSQVDRGVRLGNDTRDYNHATDGEYKRLRSEADRLYQKRNTLSQQSQQAYKQGDKGRAGELSQQAKKIAEEAEDNNRKAAEFVFRENNADSAEDEIDLHGLYVKEAEWILQRRLNAAISRNESHLKVIVGKGLHSSGGIAKLKPAIDELCDQLRLSHKIDPKNAGVLIINLGGNQQPIAPQQGHPGGQNYQQPQYQQQPHYQQQPQQQQQQQFSTGNSLLDGLLRVFCSCK